MSKRKPNTGIKKTPEEMTAKVREDQARNMQQWGHNKKDSEMGPGIAPTAPTGPITDGQGGTVTLGGP